MNKFLKIYFSLFAVAVVLASCKVTQTYERPEVNVSVADSLFRGVYTDDTTTLADVPWNEMFPDAHLQNLIAEALQNNYDLKIAIERINEADAVFKQSQLAYLPSVNANAALSYNIASLSNINLPPNVTIDRSTTPFQLAASSSWEPDIWGRIRSAEEAAYARLWQTDAVKRGVQTQIIANLAGLYFQLLGLDENLRITQEAIEIRREDVETMKALKEAAYVTGAAVVQSEANLYAAQVSLPDLKRSIREIENVIAVLTGKTPGPVERSTLAQQRTNYELNTGVPLQLLNNRPDVQAAEYAFRAAFENTNIARASFYPNLSISATGGISTFRLQNLFKSSPWFLTLGGNLSQVIFNRGQLKMQLSVAESQQMQAYYAFQQSLLTAGQEVSDALYAYETALEKQGTRSSQVASLEKAVEFNKELLRFSSATNYTDVLFAEQTHLQAQLAGVSDKMQELEAIVELYRALGGGWK